MTGTECKQGEARGGGGEELWLRVVLNSKSHERAMKDDVTIWASDWCSSVFWKNLFGCCVELILKGQTGDKEAI